jgi:hypothetical protein
MGQGLGPAHRLTAAERLEIQLRVRTGVSHRAAAVAVGAVRCADRSHIGSQLRGNDPPVGADRTAREACRWAHGPRGPHSARWRSVQSRAILPRPRLTFPYLHNENSIRCQTRTASVAMADHETDGRPDRTRPPAERSTAP